MKIRVKKTEYMELECNQTNSSLINKIYRQFFSHDIHDPNIKVQFDKEKERLIQYWDDSYHGSPVWVEKHIIQNKEQIELHNKLVQLYYLLLKCQK